MEGEGEGDMARRTVLFRVRGALGSFRVLGVFGALQVNTLKSCQKAQAHKLKNLFQEISSVLRCPSCSTPCEIPAGPCSVCSRDISIAVAPLSSMAGIH